MSTAAQSERGHCLTSLYPEDVAVFKTSPSETVGVHRPLCCSWGLLRHKMGKGQSAFTQFLLRCPRSGRPFRSFLCEWPLAWCKSLQHLPDFSRKLGWAGEQAHREVLTCQQSGAVPGHGRGCLMRCRHPPGELASRAFLAKLSQQFFALSFLAQDSIDCTPTPHFILGSKITLGHVRSNWPPCGNSAQVILLGFSCNV